MKKLRFACMVMLMGVLFYNCEDAPSLTVPPAEYITFESDEAIALVALNGTGEITVTVYASRIQSSDLMLDIDIDESSTASPVSYTVPPNVTILSGSNEGSFTVSLLDEEISNAGETLVLKLINTDSADGAFIGEPITISLVRDCPSNLEGDYVYADGNQKAVTIVRTGTNTYSVSGDSAFTTDYVFDIIDICNEITVTGGEIADSFGLAVSGNGTVDADTGNITIFYTVEGNLDNWEMTLVKQ